MPESDLSAYFGVTPRLLPHMASLLVDFDELGSDPALVVSWLREWGGEGPLRVLDLGCGKGAVSVRIARDLGARVEGIDLYAGFIEEARARATRSEVENLCVFTAGDLRKRVRTGGSFDAVLYLSVGDVMGTPADSVALLRRCVRTGGVIVLDDACSLSGKQDFPGYEHIVTREETLAQLAACGDRILREHPIPLEAMRAQNRRYMSWIEGRAQQLRTREPQLNEDLDLFLQKERDEILLLETRLQCVTWMIERAFV
jgi:SAM-dependent methyltransferase